MVDKLLNPGGMELDAAYEGPKLAEDPSTGSPVVDWPKLWQFMIEQSCCSHCGGRTSKERLPSSGRDSGILLARSRIEPNVDSSGGNKVGDAL